MLGRWVARPDSPTAACGVINVGGAAFQRPAHEDQDQGFTDGESGKAGCISDHGVLLFIRLRTPSQGFQYSPTAVSERVRLRAQVTLSAVGWADQAVVGITGGGQQGRHLAGAVSPVDPGPAGDGGSAVQFGGRTTMGRTYNAAARTGWSLGYRDDGGMRLAKAARPAAPHRASDGGVINSVASGCSGRLWGG